MTSDWLTWFQYGFILATTAVSSLIICFAFYLLRRLRIQSNFECSPALLVYLLSLLLGCLTLAVQYAVLLLANLMPPDAAYSTTQLIFWSGLLPGSLLPATPVSVLFLSIDRILIILWPSAYAGRKRPSLWLAALSAWAILVLFGINFGVNLAQRPNTEMPDCISFGCLTSDASRLIYAVNRLLVALPNFLAGATFLTVLLSFRRSIEKMTATAVRSQQKMGDRLALWVVVFEFLLDLLPNAVNLVLTMVDINVSLYVGAFRSLTYSLCALFSITFHARVLRRLCKAKTGPVRVVLPKQPTEKSVPKPAAPSLNCTPITAGPKLTETEIRSQIYKENQS